MPEKMPQQVSALNTFWLLQYLWDNHPDVDLEKLLENVKRKRPYFVENLKNGALEEVAIEHLMDTNYWLSNPFMIDLYNEIQARIPDPLLAYKMGRTSYKAQPILKTAIGVPLLGPQGIMKKIVKENSKYNRTKDTIILKQKKNHVVLRLIHHEGIKINKFAMEWHRGVYECYAKLSGATDVDIQLTCVDSDRGIYDFDIRFKEPTLFARLLQIIIYNIPMVKQAIENAEIIQMEHKEQILNRDRIIEDRTKELNREKERVEKALESEKQLRAELVKQEVIQTQKDNQLKLEKAMSGGLAHEGRNALMPAAIQIRRLMEYKDTQSAFDILGEKSGSLLNHIIKFENEYNLPRELVNKDVIPIFREINDLIKDIHKTTEEISMGVGKGLGLIDLFRTYSRTQEMTRGVDAIDASRIANDLGETYRQRLSESGVAFTVKVQDPEPIITGDFLHIESIIKNLFLNALDALEKADQKKIEISISRIVKDETPYLRITVVDTGEGIAKEQREKVFQAFYTTKAAKGTGLGLSIVKRLVEIYEGFIDFQSEVGKGTTFTVDLKS